MIILLYYVFLFLTQFFVLFFSLYSISFSSQVTNGHILVVIHMSTASQTIKVSIDDTPAQVDKCIDK